MQPRAAALVALALAAAARGGAALLTSSSSAAARAQAGAWLQAHQRAKATALAWLSEHRAAQPDELAELKGVNPEAYALVKALLTKRALGLLDPKHPTASFASPAANAMAADDVQNGAAVFQKMAAEDAGSAKVAPMYPEAPSGGHHDWLSWKPQESATDTMVQNVLGEVAALKGGSAAASPQQGEDNKEPSNDNLQWVAPSVATVDKGPAAAAQPAAPQENSYLKGLDLLPEGQGAAKKEDSHDYLSSFSWDDSSAKARKGDGHQRVDGDGHQKVDGDGHQKIDGDGHQKIDGDGHLKVDSLRADGDGHLRVGGGDDHLVVDGDDHQKDDHSEAPRPKSALMSWLSGRQPARAAPVAPKKPQNDYLSELQ